MNRFKIMARVCVWYFVKHLVCKLSPNSNSTQQHKVFQNESKLRERKTTRDLFRQFPLSFVRRVRLPLILNLELEYMILNAKCLQEEKCYPQQTTNAEN